MGNVNQEGQTEEGPRPGMRTVSRGGDCGIEFRVWRKIRKPKAASRMETEPEACHTFF